jgi:AcrR family transcriptional regulator
MTSEPMDTNGAAIRPVLTRDRIIEAAVAVVDEGGIDALTMRAVSRRLGAGTMSLYRHVASRDELLDLVLEAMASEVGSSPLTGRWRDDLASIARDMRSGLVKRPQLTVLLTSRSGRGGAELPMLDRTLGVLRGAGFGRRGAARANQALGNYVAGAALWEAVGLAGTHGEDREAQRQAVADMVAALPADVFPNLAWVGSRITADGPDDRFEFGLTCLLDGFEAYLARRKG